MYKSKVDEYALPNIIKQSIIDDIVQGKLASGDKLLETKYSERFGTSRSPVREAFYLLTLEGYAEKIPRKGTVVKGFSAEDIGDILEIRNMLEQLAIERMTAENRLQCVKKMKKIVAEMKQEGIDKNQYTKLNYDFHFHLILSSGSEVILNAYSKLYSPLISLQGLSFMTENSITNSIKEHEELIELLIGGEIEKAKSLLNSHNKAVFFRVRGAIK
ncbi:GntR family transcriptional regulator [Bacillus sp. FJAT-45350]|uniref:GntR family transcriptional regulator n=1 Tax=Bacillus sp. FJAT-45350 TaxID=2011014 RepID=UPI000BB7BAE5|nr:GntR family transcriptional regulator [Bacillus sp. FJAT-45350]